MRYLSIFSLLISLTQGAALYAATGVGIIGDQNRVVSAKSVEAYLIALEQAEAEFGAYGEASADIYIGLGNALLENKEFDKARDAFSRGMQIQRVNFGLYDLSQIPYLTLLADTAKSQSDWRSAATFLHQASVIQKHNSDVTGLFLLESLQQRIDLHLLAYAHIGGSEEGFKHLEQAYMVDLREVQTHLPDPATQLEGYLASREKTAIINYEMAVFNLAAPVAKTSFSSMGGNATDNAYKNMDNYYVSGRKSLASVVEAVENHADDPRRLANAYINLADWYIMFDKTNSAVKNYKKAYKIAAMLQNGDEIAEKLFSNPVILPRFNLPGPPSQIKDAHQLMYSLTVSRYGKAFAIKLLDDNDDVPVSTLRRGREYLKSVRFRPRLGLEGPMTIQNHVISIYVR